MHKLLQLKRGFTLVELIVVIAVIGILATITVVGLNRYQGDTRDARRASSATVIAEALEKYYDKNGEYPSCSKITAATSTLINDTLVGVDANSLKAPLAPGGQTNSLSCSATLTVNGDDFYQYVGDGSTTCAGTGSCLSYSLKYKEESTNSVKSLTSRRNTSIATSGGSTLTITTTNFDSVVLGWTEVPNAGDYVIESCTTATCDAGTTTDVVGPSSSLTSTVSGLSQGTAYWFRVKPTSTSAEGVWSNIAATTTKNLVAPVATATANSNSQITVAWPLVNNANSYTLEYSSVNDNFASGVTSIPDITSLSQPITGLETAVQYYFRVRAVNLPFNSAWSTMTTATTFVPVPATITATVNSVTQITVSWSSISVVGAQYRLQNSTNNFSSVTTTYPDSASTSLVITGLQQGTTQYYRVYAVVGTTPSNASSTASGTTPVTGPSLYEYRASRNEGGTGAGAASNYWMPGAGPGSGSYNQVAGIAGATCPSGTTTQYYMSAAYNASSPGPYATGWTTLGTWHIVSPSSPYRATFTTSGRCVGANATSAQADWGTRCVTYSGAGC